MFKTQLCVLVISTPSYYIKPVRNNISREIVPRGRFLRRNRHLAVWRRFLQGRFMLGTISPAFKLLYKSRKVRLFFQDLRHPPNPPFSILSTNSLYDLYCPQLPSRCVLCLRVIKHNSRRYPTIIF